MAVQLRSPVRVAAPLEIADDGGITLPASLAKVIGPAQGISQ
ncbi:hypothetical protein ACFVGV_16575 [Pseudarthrobacter scleromae]